MANLPNADDEADREKRTSKASDPPSEAKSSAVDPLAGKPKRVLPPPGRKLSLNEAIALADADFGKALKRITEDFD